MYILSFNVFGKVELVALGNYLPRYKEGDKYKASSLLLGDFNIAYCEPGKTSTLVDSSTFCGDAWDNVIKAGYKYVMKSTNAATSYGKYLDPLNEKAKDYSYDHALLRTFEKISAEAIVYNPLPDEIKKLEDILKLVREYKLDSEYMEPSIKSLKNDFRRRFTNEWSDHKPIILTLTVFE